MASYYQLTKPGIIYGNALNAAAGFLLASKGDVNLQLFGFTLAGISLLIAGACVFNNYLDRGIDAKMARTSQRALVSRTVSVKTVIVYASILSIAGLSVLAWQVNLLTVALGVIAFISYVLVYGIAKRRTVHGTAVGSISGALPPVAGYTAVAGQLDTGALLLFLVLIAWQMPHFFAIAMYRFDDYKAAGLPVLPVSRGLHRAKVQILIYIAAFILICALFTVFDYTGWTFLTLSVLLGLAWLHLGIKGWKVSDDKRWARQMFFFSLLVILGLDILLAVGPLLP